MNIPTGYRVRGQKPLTLFSFVWRKRDMLLDNRIPIRQILPLCDCDEHKRVQRYAKTCQAGSERLKGGEPIFTDSKYRAAPDFAITHKEDNGTPVQSQSERDKTVAGNEGGSVRTTVGVELPWCQFAADRLATSHSISGCRGQIEMLLSYQPNERWS